MSKTKSHLIKRYYKENYLCEENHSLIWEGKLLLHKFSPCNKCGLTESNGITIRWKCDKCNKIYCCKCYPIIVESKCPNNHYLKETNKFSECNFNGFYCDKCFIHFNTSDGVFYDKECNYTIYLKCFKDASDIPDIIED